MFTACSSNGGSSPSGSTDSPNSAPVEITQWYHDYGEDGTQDAVMRYADEFNKSQSDIHVNVVWVTSDYDSKLNAALLAGTGPDVFETTPIGDRILAGQVAALEDLFGSALSDFNQNNIAAVSVNGHIYGVPQSDGTGLIYYRKSMLDAAGVKPPTTMDELIADAKALTTTDHKGLFIGNDGCTSGNLPEIAIWSSGNDILKDGQVGFDNDRTVQVFNKMRELCTTNADSLLIGAPSDWYAPDAFIDGLAAMQFAGQWSLPQIQDALGDDFGVVPWPKLDDQGVPSTWFGGWYSQVNAASKNLEAAKTFVKWLWIDNVEAQTDWCTSYGSSAPVRTSIVSDTPALTTGVPADFMSAITQYGHLLGGVYWSQAGQDAIGTALANVVRNNADPTTEVHNAAATFASEVQRLQAGSQLH